MKNNKADIYWKKNLKYLTILLSIWFTVSFGFGVILVDQLNECNSDILFEHPLGFMRVSLDYQKNGVYSVVKSARIIRTARKLSSGLIYIPSSIWKA